MHASKSFFLPREEECPALGKGHPLINHFSALRLFVFRQQKLSETFSTDLLAILFNLQINTKYITLMAQCSTFFLNIRLCIYSYITFNLSKFVNHFYFFLIYCIDKSNGSNLDHFFRKPCMNDTKN